MKSFFLFLLTLFYFIPGNAQPANHYTVRYYTTENGLPSNGIKGLQWDEKTGFLWMATEAGVARFNGIDIKSYTKDNTNIIRSERMQFLVRNLKGDIYTLDQAGTIIGIKKNKLFLREKKNTENINLGTITYGLAVSDTFFNYRINHPSQVSFIIGFQKLIPLTDTSLIILKNNDVYYNTVSDINPQPLGFTEFHIVSGFLIGKKCFLVSNKKEFFLFDVAAKKIVPLSFNAPASGVKKINDKKSVLLWSTGLENPILIFENTAWQLLFDGEKMVAEEICNAIPTGILFQYAQYSKEKKLLFLGTDSKGFIVISSNKVQPVKKANSQSNERNAYYSQIELPDGNILTNEGHIIGLHPESFTKPPLKGKLGFNISRTGDSLLWYSQFDSALKFSFLHCYNTRTKIITNYPKINVPNALVLTTTNGKTIIGTQEGIGELVSDSVNYLYLFTPNNIGGTGLGDMKEIKPGLIAIAVMNGVLRFNTNSLKIDTLFYEENLSVRTLFYYNDYLFAGTYGKGFYMLKNNTVKKMPLDKNKFLLYTHCFVPDSEGYCWISTNRGLFKTNLNELASFFENNNSKIYYHYLGRNDGMDITEMNGGCTPCAITLKGGTLSFPTMDGLLWVSPKKANILLPEGELYFDEVFVDNKKVNIDTLAFKRLDFKTKEIIFHIGFSAWCNQENIYIDYKLKNDDKWTTLNTANGAVIQLNNLPQGKYILQIRKLNGFGINNYTYREITFSIAIPWYKKKWFYGICLLSLLSIIIFYFRQRTKQFKIRQKKLEAQVTEKTKELLHKNEVLEKSNSINTRLISIISHDIITPLKFLTVAGKSLQEKRKQMPEELQEETISEMTNTSQELQLLSTNILNWIKYQNENRRLVKENFNLYELVQQVLGILQTLARQKKLVIENKVSEELMIHQYYEPLKIMIYNLLTNAIHFTERGAIEVSSIVSNEKITISVTDQGVGMSPEKIKSLMADQVVISSANVDNKKGHGLGYLIIKDLLKTMGATLDIESKKGEGSKVSISFPVNNLTGK